MSKMSRIQIYDKLDKIQIPGTDISPIKFKGVKGLELTDDGNVEVRIELPSQAKGHELEFRTSVKEALMTVEGVQSVGVTLIIQDKAYGQVERQNLLPNVKHPILIGSGKGGVGKSTVTVNLAVALAKAGYRVGLMDADLYGPSIPTMFAIDEQPEANEKGQIIPLEKHGVKLISIGFLLEDDTPVVWRGPLLHKAIQQFMKDVDWGELDFLLIDLPPGTGDVQLSVAQSTRVSGAIAVSTPQDVALIDVKKAISMFQTLKIPLLGLVENMSFFRCTDCGHIHYIFGGDTKMDAGAKLAAEVLGKVPITIAIRECGDDGIPVTLREPESEAATEFNSVAKKIADRLIK
ncbi:MAG: sodium:proton antiporter [Acidobacteria bacterium CG_4_9_14_3_um_filter_49_7]|nr:MAG: sodium:proton antiporter [Acidobacteria bacterium CG_4_9_14_3_um_filter_49_7]